jgi:hypothetical protein
VAGSSGHGDEVQVTMKGEEFLDQMSDYKLRCMRSGTGCASRYTVTGQMKQCSNGHLSKAMSPVCSPPFICIATAQNAVLTEAYPSHFVIHSNHIRTQATNKAVANTQITHLTYVSLLLWPLMAPLSIPQMIT